MMDILLTTFIIFSLSCFLFGFQTILFIPLSFIFAVKKKKPSVLRDPLVSVIVPAYNEGMLIANCVSSILASDYRKIEIILVDDGSKDNTLQVMQKFAGRPNVTVISKPNSGKASALNKGIEATHGEIIFCIDGDTVFKKDTVRQALNAFTSAKVGAVCGHDSPINLNNWQLKLFNLQNHVGTGFVRRALSLIDCLPIVSGNIGAFRKSVISEIGGFRNNFIGEDLELTFRIHKAGYKVVFQPRAQVFTESPSSISAFWKQRVRWGRGFIQTLKIHKNMVFNPKYGLFGMFLGFNALSMIVIPALQFVSLFILPILILNHQSPISTRILGTLGYLGVIFTFFISVYSIILDKSYKDLKYLPAIFLWIVYSLIIDFVIIRSIYLEIRGTEALWNKFERTGIVSKKVISKSSVIPVKTRKPGWQVPSFAVIGALMLVLTGSIISGKRLETMFSKTAIAETAPLMNFSHTAALPFQNTRAVAVHFEQYDDWRDAYKTVLNSKADINTVGVGAGRLDWTYFKWKGHREWWSNDLKGSVSDLLKVSSEKLKQRGYNVVAIVDMFAPRYIKVHSEAAAKNFVGQKSTKEVCLQDLAHGNFGRQMLEMIGYIAKNYPIDAIDITELSYQNHCYDDRCKQAFLQASGEDRWPTRWLRGGVNVDDKKLIEWRCNEVAGIIKKMADIVHAYGKKLYVDVDVSWDNFADNSREKGQDYKKLLQYADKLVIWDYFNFAGKSPESSEKLAAYLNNNFPKNQIILSVGLWGKDGRTVRANDMGQALASSIKGGVGNFWMTPSYMLSADHWKVLGQIYKVQN